VQLFVVVFSSTAGSRVIPRVQECTREWM